MLENILKYFEKIASIPHCSHETKNLAEYIKSEALELGYDVKEDSVGNILCSKGSPKICLQSHYDMVCMGDAPRIELVRKDHILSAKNSSLGADNGMGVAIMLNVMSEHKNLECLFTNDEEVGMLGVEGLGLRIKSQNLLNLDSEEEDEVIIGCAGGVDIYGKMQKEYKKSSKNLNTYEVSIDAYPGGHSGVDIAKNIPNAIKSLAYFLVKNECKLVSFIGGERTNSIPKSAKAVVLCQKDLKSKDSYIKVKKVKKVGKFLKNSKKILHMINSFSQGVRVYDEGLLMPITSINLSSIKEYEKSVEVEFFARSMKNDEIKRVKSQTKSLLEGFGFDVKFKRQTLPWEPDVTPFAKDVAKCAKSMIPKSKICAVHAGLECGIIVKKQKHIKGVCSIGPTIKYPHSTREHCDLNSLEKISKVVDEVIKKYS